MLPWLLGFWNQAKQWWWVAGLLGLASAYLFARKEGENAILAEQAKKRDKLQNEYAKIDANRPDVDGALNDLQRRADKKLP